MRGLGTTQRMAKAAGLWLALAAMVLRLALPVGWMPSTSLAAPIVMCTPNGPMQMEMPPDEGGQKPAPDKHHDSCPFAAAPHFASLSPVPTPALPVPWLLAKRDVAAQSAQPYAHRHSPQSPRAPPLMA